MGALKSAEAGFDADGSMLAQCMTNGGWVGTTRERTGCRTYAFAKSAAG